MIKVGSRWSSTDKNFRVISVVEIDNHTWVHYREDSTRVAAIECKEYSCYEESFLLRFRPLPE